MTPSTRLRNALTTMRWGYVALANELRVNERTVRRWVAGRNEPPPDILAWLEEMAAFVESHPPP